MFGLNIKSILINVPITLIALTIHEFAHGWVSEKLGDPTPRMQGRLTLNPLAHLDLVGTLLMIITGFGWAKPVSVDPRYYKDTKKGMALTAAAGPLSNLILAFIAMLIATVFMLINRKFALGFETAEQITIDIAFIFAMRNLCFAVFNIIPIPPLDGAKVLGMFLPDRTYYKMLQYERYFMILIMLLSLTGVFSAVIGTGVNILMNGILKLLAAAANLIM